MEDYSTTWLHLDSMGLRVSGIGGFAGMAWAEEPRWQVCRVLGCVCKL
jgi:hypothetical protein